jgi:hypothetical protein
MLPHTEGAFQVSLDGDTIEVLHSKHAERIRLKGIRL